MIAEVLEPHVCASLEDRISSWNGVAVVSHYDRPTGTWIFIALHDDALGTPTGGTRMRVYARPDEGLADAMRLAEGMTSKWAAIDFPFGGGKAVLAIPHPMVGEQRRGLLQRYGRLLCSLRGAFATGADLGTTTEDMLEIGRVAPYVHGVDLEKGVAIDPGPYTARGVFAAIRAGLRHVDGTDDLTGRTVLVEGVGSVGRPLARHLAAAGARLLLADLAAENAAALAAELGAEIVSCERVAGTACDVYAPCAVGASLNAETIPRLACRLVAGSANNQLREASDAARLLERGILYAPDYVANAGGALGMALRGRNASAEEIDTRLDGLGSILDTIFTESAARSESPVEGAKRRVEAVLARARGAAA